MYTSECAECGQDMQVDDLGISTHLTDEGETDFDQDADHVAYSHEDECDDGMSDAEADADVLRSAGWGTDEDYNPAIEEDYYAAEMERDLGNND
jgi:hypothetical protein